MGLALLILVAVVLAVAIVVRLVLDPVAAHQTRKALDKLEGLRGDFAKVHVTVLAPGYEITNLELREENAPRNAPPLVFVKKARVGLDWRELLRGRLVASVALHEPKLSITAAKTTKQQPSPKAPDLSAQLEDAPPLRIDRLEVFQGELLVRFPEGEDNPRLWIHRLDLTGQNLASRPAGAGGRPAMLSARAMVARSGTLRMFVTANPFASPLAFAGEASIQGLRVTDLHAFLAAKTDVEAISGTIDLFATFTSKDGAINGGVKPVLKNLELRSADQGPWADAKSWLLDKAVDIASDRVPRRNAVATTIPIKGKLVAPDIQLWPAVLGVVRNAFVAGLVSGFANLPPDTASDKQGVLEQTVDALQEDEGPPNAQPRKK